VQAGVAQFDGRALDLRTPAAWSALRGKSIGYVPQDTQAAFDPLSSVGSQISEVLRLRGLTRAQASARALELLTEAGLEDAAMLQHALPERLSGGQRQRAAIAAALACDPPLLIADEPTSALDPVHARALIDLLDRLRRERALALLWISHDLPAITARADRVLFLHAGRVIETLAAAQTPQRAVHPYTRLLLRSLPHGPGGGRTLAALAPPGEDPPPRAAACGFHARCPLTDERCRTSEPALVLHGESHRVACHHVDRAVSL
jgi:oligopeptide/dipeptide ABC transporter ATP-binding protein